MWTLTIPWHLPFGSFHVGIDLISLVFLIPVLVLGAAAAIFSKEYFSAHGGAPGRGYWLWLLILCCSMVLVVTARDGVLFLLAWEGMALSSFFLVMHDDRDAAVQRAGWVYLVASQLGTGFLLGLFGLMTALTQSTDFSVWESFGVLFPDYVQWAFLLTLIGFGVKAGLMPFHVWLPEAHPAAPSPVSALMSGAMIKMGVYGLFRFVSFLGEPSPWWGYLLIALGAISAVAGILMAINAHDLKRLLAYCSVENVGIISMALGLALLGVAFAEGTVTALALGGGLLHVLNHAFSKGLLFLSAGAVVNSTGTRQMDLMGGCAKEMPLTNIAFLTGSASISGLPPFNSFVSEFLLYAAAYFGVTSDKTVLIVCSLIVIGALALSGGLAAACFTKAYGAIFLGSPREPGFQAHGEAGRLSRLVMAALAAACLVLGVCGPVLAACSLDLPSELVEALYSLSAVFLMLIAVTLLLTALRLRILKHREVSQALTWDCGYAAPSVRMQYTASSFSQPFTRMFHSLLQTRIDAHLPSGFFPERWRFNSSPQDLLAEQGYHRAFRGLQWIFEGARWLQHGYLHLYVLYIALTIIALVAWGM